MTDVELFVAANELFGHLVTKIKKNQWGLVSPITPEWDIRHLVEHVTDDNRWVPDMISGRTTHEVADKFHESALGADPVVSWTKISRAANTAVQGADDLAMIVHLSFADVSLRDYLAQMIIDRVIHSWDLATGIQQKFEADPELVQAAYDRLAPQADSWRNAGIFAAAVEVPHGASTLTKLLGISGRSQV